MLINNWLVVDSHPSEQYEDSSIGMMTFPVWENTIHVPVTTNQIRWWLFVSWNFNAPLSSTLMISCWGWVGSPWDSFSSQKKAGSETGWIRWRECFAKASLHYSNLSTAVQVCLGISIHTQFYPFLHMGLQGFVTNVAVASDGIKAPQPRPLHSPLESR